MAIWAVTFWFLDEGRSALPGRLFLLPRSTLLPPRSRRHLALCHCLQMSIPALAGKATAQGWIPFVETPGHWSSEARSMLPEDRYEVLEAGLDPGHSLVLFLRISGVTRRTAASQEHIASEMVRNCKRKKHTGCSITSGSMSLQQGHIPCS
jgi:hypothetical protein